MLIGTKYKLAAGVCLEVLGDRLNEANFYIIAQRDLD